MERTESVAKSIEKVNPHELNEVSIERGHLDEGLRTLPIQATKTSNLIYFRLSYAAYSPSFRYTIDFYLLSLPHFRRHT